MPIRLARLTLLAGTALSNPLLAGELPTGATVTHGSVGISTPAPGRMAIRQSSDSAIVSWRRFSIGESDRVDIRQPSKDAAILNRVTGSTTSRINGQLNANGRVYLVNPNGIAIGAKGTVKAGAFVASTLDIDDEAFLEGRHEFRGNGASAAVENHGAIKAGPGSYAALIGARIDNSGTISVPLGRIGLGAGERVTLNLSGDGFMAVALPSDDANDEALITHSGRLSADGGRVEIKAATARQAARQAINLKLPGVVEARTVSGRNGAIVLGGGAGGKVAVSGRLDASARTAKAAQRPKARPTGGSIDVTGAEVTLAGARIDASGTGGGGTIRIGGDYQGQGDLQRATYTSVDPATRISADALGRGDGGRIIVWSDEYTAFGAKLSARGGADGGNGGLAEVSGKALLAFAGKADLSAAKGAFGTLLLDPYDVVISTDPTTQTFYTSPPDYIAAGPSSVINVNDLESNLASANVLVETTTFAGSGTEAGDISLLTDLEWSSGSTLTLIAENDIFINDTVTIRQSISGFGGTLTLDANDDIVINGAIDAPGGTLSFTARGFDSASSPTIDVNAPITATNGTIEMYSEGNVISVASPVAASSIRLDSTRSTFPGNVFVDGPLTVTGLGSIAILGDNVTVGAGSTLTGPTSIGASGDVTLNGDMTAGIRDIDVAAGDDIVVNGDLSANNISLNALDSTADAAAAISGNGTVTADIVTINAAGDIDFGGSITAASVAEISAASRVSVPIGNVTLRGPVQAGSLLSVFADQNVSLGAVSIGRQGIASIEASTGSLTMTGRLAANRGDVTLTASDSILLGGPVLVRNGTFALNLDPFGARSVLPTAAATIDVGTFSLSDGTWSQIGSRSTGLPAFAATDFQLVGSAEFLRAAGGSGSASNPYMLTDVYGLQGMASSSLLASAFALANDIDASPAATWSGGLGFTPIGSPSVKGPFEGSLDGRGHIISDLTIALSGFFQPAGLFGVVTSNGEIRNLGLVDANVTGGNATGALVGSMDGVIENVYATGEVVGGTATGGLVGVLGSNGSVEVAYADVDVSGVSAVGGLVGENDGAIAMTYASGVVSGSATVGGLVGQNVGSIDQSFALGAVSGQTSVGGLAGTSRGLVTGSFWDTGTTGQSSSAAGTGLSSADFQDFDTFTTIAAQEGWNFHNVWAPPNSYPLLYALSPVIWAQPDDVTAVYGDSFTLTGAISGGPSVYVFGPVGETIPSSGLFRAPAAGSVGTYAITPVAAVRGSAGTTYSVRRSSTPGTLTITAAPLTITARDQAKVYGRVFTFDGTEFSVSGLVSGDSVSSVALSSPGALATANVGDYAIAASNARGSGLSNYNVTYLTGELSVTPATLRITANDQTKVYGNVFTFDGTEFSVSGLFNADGVNAVALSSLGAAAGAGVGQYAIDASNAQGTGLSNYDITYVPGELRVTPRGTPRPDPDDIVDVPLAPRFTTAVALPQPADTIVVAALETGAGGVTEAVGRAETTLGTLGNLGNGLEAAVETCRRSEPSVETYLACLGTELDKYAAALDAMALDLPEPLQGVSAIIERASGRVAAARATAVRRLATASSEAEAEQIGREAVAEAQAAISDAQAEIRQAIALIRAEEPQVARLEVAQGNAITAALDSVGTSLERSVGL